MIDGETASPAMENRSKIPRSGFSIRAALLGMAAVPLVALFAALAYDTYRDDEENIARANRTAMRIAEATASQAELTLARAQHYLSVLAQRPKVRALDPADCDPLLVDLKKLAPEYANVLTLDAKGRLVCSAIEGSPTQAVGPDPKYYFAETVRSRRFTIGKPAIGFISSRWVSTLASPIVNSEGQLTGVVAVGVDLAAFRPLAAQKSLPPSAVIGIINSERTIIARSDDPEQRVGTVSEAELSKIVVERRHGSVRARNYAGTDRFVGFTPIAHSDWFALVTLDAATVLAPARRIALERLAFAIAFLLCVAALTLWVTRRIARPIEAVSKSISAVRRGELFKRAPANGPAEIRQIAEELNSMLDARTHAEAALRESAEKLGLFVQHAPSAIAMFDRDMRYIANSRRWLADYGLGEQELAGRSHYEVFPEISERWKEIHRRCLAGTIESCDEDAFVRADGHTDWVRWEVLPWRTGDGEVGGIIIFSEVITKRKLAEREIEYKSAVLGAQQESSPDAILVVDEDARIVSYNRKFLDLWKIPEELAKAGVDEPVLHSVIAQVVDADAFLARIRYLYEHKEEKSEDVLETTDGRIIERHSAPALGSGGRYFGRIWYFRDITVRKRSESELRASEQRFRAMIEQSISGTCIIDREGRFVYLNPRLTDILGYQSSEPLVGRPAMEFVAPESRDLVRENMRQRAAGEPQSARYSFEAIRKDGSHITLGAHGNVGIYLGEPMLITTVQDVTELSRAENELRRTVEKLTRAVQSTIEVISTIGELRDPYTHGHERRVGEIATSIAAELGLAADFVEGLRIAGYLHDVGKIAIPAEILSKPSRLSKAEFDLVKGHAQQSYEILRTVELPWPVAEAAWQHHERMDGSGYPRGLKGDQIILEARILAVADTVEAMASHRPYRPGLGIDKALAEIERCRDTMYDPTVVDACLRIFRDKGYEIPA